MTAAQDMRDQLAAVLNEGGHRTHYAERMVDELLPVVRAFAADELDDAAAAVSHAMARQDALWAERAVHRAARQIRARARDLRVGR